LIFCGHRTQKKEQKPPPQKPQPQKPQPQSPRPLSTHPQRVSTLLPKRSSASRDVRQFFLIRSKAASGFSDSKSLFPFRRFFLFRYGRGRETDSPCANADNVRFYFLFSGFVSPAFWLRLSCFGLHNIGKWQERKKQRYRQWQQKNDRHTQGRKTTELHSDKNSIPFRQKLHSIPTKTPFHSLQDPTPLKPMFIPPRYSHTPARVPHPKRPHPAKSESYYGDPTPRPRLIQ